MKAMTAGEKMKRETDALRKKQKSVFRSTIDYVLKHNPEIDPAKVDICPNSIDVRDVSMSEEERNTIRMKYGIPLDKKVFVYGGNLGKPQGIPFIIECLKARWDYSDIFFLIVGNGTEYKKLDAFFQSEHPSNMKLMKHLPKEDYEKLVAACDVGMIFLSYRFTIPNFPSRLLSYMQAGLPVLCCTDPNTDVGKVCVEGGFGTECLSNDPTSFATCVEQMYRADLDKMGTAGRKYLEENYSSAKAYQKIWGQLYDGITES